MEPRTRAHSRQECSLKHFPDNCPERFLGHSPNHFSTYSPAHWLQRFVQAFLQAFSRAFPPNRLQNTLPQHSSKHILDILPSILWSTLLNQMNFVQSRVSTSSRAIVSSAFHALRAPQVVVFHFGDKISHMVIHTSGSSPPNPTLYIE